MFCLQSHSISYKAICRWLLLLLGLEVSGEAGPAVNQGQLLLVLGLGPLSQRCELSESQMMLIQENLGKSEAWAKTNHLYRKPLETAWVGLKAGWGRASGNHQGGVKSMIQVDRVSDMALSLPALQFCEGRAQERNAISASTSVWEKVAPRFSP